MTELLTPKEIAAFLRVPVRSTMELLRSGQFPAPAINLSQKTRRWLRADVEAWLAKKAKQNAR